jgi:adenylate cyclase
MELTPEEQAESSSRRKRVFRILSLYAVTGWLLTQVVTTVAPYLDLPSWTVRYVIILVILGLPAALIYALTSKEGSSKLRTLVLLGGCAVFTLVLSVGVSRLMPNAGDKPVEAKPLGEKSIAVLPFVDLSEKQDQEYFGDGLSEELLNVLAKIRGLKVIARTSSFYFKGKNEDMRTIGQKLSVAHVLEGSVRKSGNHLRITAQLIRTDNGTHLWSETYDRTLDDIFKIQDEIARAVVSKLEVTMSAAPHPDASAEAFNLYLEGKYFTNKREKESAARAVEKYKQALKLEPHFAIAWAELAAAYSYQATNGFIPTEEGYALATEAVQKALQIDPYLPDAYAMQSRIYSTHDWDWPNADASIKKALAVGSANALTLSNAGILAMHFGRFDEAIELYKKAIEVDPLRTATYYNQGLGYYYAGRWTAAKASFRKVLELNPAFASANYQLARVFLMENNYDSALLVMMNETDESWKLDGLPLVYFKLNRLNASEEILKEIISKYADDSAFQIAEIYAYRGEVDLAFQWLERAYQQRDAGLANIRVEPMLKSLHRDSRWLPFLKKMRLE